MKAPGAVMVMMVLTLPSALWGKKVSKSSLDFAVRKAAKLRCNIAQSSHAAWDLRVVARDSKDHPIFEYLYSVRKNVSAAMQDCNAWIKAVKKEKHSSGSPAHLTTATDPAKKRR